VTSLRGRRPRYADVAATLALLLAMGGTAYAATSLAPGSVGTKQLKSHAVTSGKLAPQAVSGAKIADLGIGQQQLGARSVTHTKLGPASINSFNLAVHSIALDDMQGGDVVHSIGFTVAAHFCKSINFNVAGAIVGEIVIFSFVGNTTVPSTLAFGGTKVASDGVVTIHTCNVGSTAVTVSHLGIRIATLA
jgi:hypothetical protein